MCELALERAHKHPFITIVETRTSTIYPEPLVGQEIIDCTELLMKRAGSDIFAQSVARPGTFDYVDRPVPGTVPTLAMPSMSSFVPPAVASHPMPQPDMPVGMGLGRMPIALAMPLPNQGATQLGANPPIGESIALFTITSTLIITLLALTLTLTLILGARAGAVTRRSQVLAGQVGLRARRRRL